MVGVKAFGMRDDIRTSIPHHRVRVDEDVTVHLRHVVARFDTLVL